MSAGNVSARDAALSIILGDVEPLVQRVEEAALLLATVEKELTEDLTKLGALVQRVTDAQAELHGNVKRVHDTVVNAQAVAAAAAKGARTGGPSPSPRPASGLSIWLACLASSIVGAAIVGGTLYVVGRDLVDQARVGRSLNQAWPALDEATRKRVEQVLNGSR